MTATAFGGRRTRNFQQEHLVGGCAPNSAGYCACPLQSADEDAAELVCSDIGPVTDPWGDAPPFEGHMPVIDLDLPCRLVPSGTAGNFHLYIDRAVTFDHYLAVLKAMADAGIVQWGFHDATERRGFGSVRHPDRPKR